MLLTLSIGTALMISRSTPATDIEGRAKEVPVLPQFYQAPTQQAKLYEISARVHVKSRQEGAASKGEVSMPIPNDYSGQTLISLRVKSEPSTALASWRLKDFRGLNRVLNARVSVPEGGLWLTYEARILVPASEVIRTQQKNFNDWRRPTAFAQSTDRQVAALASPYRSKLSHQDEVVSSLVHWVAKNRTGEGETFSDASGALAHGGNALGRSSLCAALLRSLQIPARLVMYFPSWASGAEACSWLTEYASADGAWQIVDPTIGINFPARNSIVVARIFEIQDETPSALRSPFAAVFRTSAGLMMDWPAGGSPTFQLRNLRSFPGQSSARVMSAGARRRDQVVAAGMKGEPQWFDEAKFNEALGLGPTNFALFLDGHPMVPHH